MTLGVRTKLFLISLGLIVLTVALGYAYVHRTVERELTREVQAEIAIRARLAAAEVERLAPAFEDVAAWQRLAGTLAELSSGRVTLARADRRVLADSAGESPLDLGPEFEGALDLGRAQAIRADAAGTRTTYAAAAFRREGRPAGVVIVSVPLSQVDAVLGRVQRLLGVAALFGIALAVVLSSIAAHLASRTARSLTESAQRMAAGDLATRVRPTGRDELAELGNALDHLAHSLSSSLEELKQQNARTTGILTRMQEGVLLLGPDGRVGLVNPALREMLLLGADAVGKTPLEVIRHTELKQLLDRALHDGQTVTAEIEVGGLKPRRLLVRAAPLEGDQSGVFAVFVDVTEVRRLESLRRDFVANVSHELRTPVTAIRSAAETLQLALERDPKSAARFVDIVDRNAVRLHELVEDLLDLSRIESRQYKLTLEPLELEPIIRRTLGLFRDRAEKKGIRMAVDVPEDLPRVEADRRALEHVLTNLIDNAVKYCPPGALVTVRASVVVGGKVQLAVLDSGPGIDEKHLPRLFERFYRVDAGRSRELGGTGLGLSIVKHLVEAMGSNVIVDSTVGVGTTFRFSLSRAAPA